MLRSINLNFERLYFSTFLIRFLPGRGHVHGPDNLRGSESVLFPDGVIELALCLAWPVLALGHDHDIDWGTEQHLDAFTKFQLQHGRCYDLFHEFCWDFSLHRFYRRLGMFRLMNSILEILLAFGGIDFGFFGVDHLSSSFFISRAMLIWAFIAASHSFT